METKETAIDRVRDVEQKLKRVRRFMEANQFDAVFLQRQDSFAWLTSGGHNGIPYNSEAGECALLVTDQECYLLANTIEMPRIAREEVYDLPFTMVEYPWYDEIASQVRRIIGDGRVATDQLVDGMILESRLAGLRFALTELEVERYRYAGEQVARLTEQYCMSLRPGQTEWDIAAGLHHIYLSQGLIPTVTLVACDERLDSYRHPTPTAQPLRKKGMVVACVRYKGLIIALTRMVCVGQPPDDLGKTFVATAMIDAEMIDATRPGVYTDQLFERVKALYAEVGFDGEWVRHHQGGAIGYRNRDYLITPPQRYQVLPNQAFAWNPSIRGTKSEDTILVGATGAEVVTVSNGSWPQIDVPLSSGKTMRRPAIYQI
ncbi:M24 family metallopeptidase [Brevibacillus humidisoli]|uniref:M24 family metallopeptidase n=1 Tax=Brevibacillus humidisoli TaxID=2895522 RepID=UPI001E53659E|nr:M24 family metallopeptidase [Brevibacillus humidisoli]UFJ40285.1 M24 family metallopeptidase [Brevibacillus humidisoli]